MRTCIFWIVLIICFLLIDIILITYFNQLHLLHKSLFVYITPYFVGVLTAHILLTGKSSHCESTVTKCSICALVLLLLTIFLMPLLITERKAEKLHNFTYLMMILLSNFAFNLLVAITIWCLALSKRFAFKQLPFWVPLSRLTLGMFLVHIPLIWFNVQQNTHVQELSSLYMVRCACRNLHKLTICNVRPVANIHRGIHGVHLSRHSHLLIRRSAVQQTVSSSHH